MNLPRSGLPTKLTPRGHQQVEKVTKEPRTMYNSLQVSSASVKVGVKIADQRKTHNSPLHISPQNILKICGSLFKLRTVFRLSCWGMESLNRTLWLNRIYHIK